jgi:hypothetical protein
MNQPIKENVMGFRKDFYKKTKHELATNVLVALQKIQLELQQHNDLKKIELIFKGKSQAKITEMVNRSNLRHNAHMRCIDPEHFSQPTINE